MLYDIMCLLFEGMIRISESYMYLRLSFSSNILNSNSGIYIQSDPSAHILIVLKLEILPTHYTEIKLTRENKISYSVRNTV